METERVISRLTNEVHRGPSEITLSLSDAKAVLNRVQSQQDVIAILLGRLKARGEFDSTTEVPDST